MTELSLNILDICQNSIKANCTEVIILINEDIKNDVLILDISDNGCGMEKEFLEKVEDPFTTTRTTRKVGMGIPLLKMECEMAGGTFKIDSEKNVGTKIHCTFQYSNIDRLPLGNVCDTVLALIRLNPDIDFIYNHIVNGKSFEFSTKEVKNILGDVPLNNNEVLEFIKNYLDENIENLYGGII